MPRPRRPILAAACAALLVSTAVIWVRGYLRSTSVGRQQGDRVVSVDVANGEVGMYWGAAGYPWLGSHWFAYDTEADQYSDGYHPLWFWSERQFPGWSASAPMWFVALIPALGLWWFWRGRKAAVGFPVENVTVKS